MNLVMIAILLTLVYAQKFSCFGLPVWLALWSLGSPLFLFFNTAYITIVAKASYKYA